MKAIMLIALLAIAPAAFTQTAQSREPRQPTDSETVWALLGTVASDPQGEQLIRSSGVEAETAAKIMALAKNASAKQVELGRATPQKLCPQREFYKNAPEHLAARLDEMKAEEEDLQQKVVREFDALLTESERTLLRTWMAESVSIQVFDTETGGNVLRSGRASPEQLLNKACGGAK